MISDQGIINEVCKEVPVTVTFFELVKHIAKKYNLAKWKDLHKGDKLTIFSKLNLYSNKSLYSLSRKRLYDLYHMLTRACFLENGEDPDELVKIKEKLSKRFCFILKELIKPKNLVREDSFSMFKKLISSKTKTEKNTDIYFIPNPSVYKNKLYDWSEINIKTKQMRDARDRKHRTENLYNKRVNDMQKRRELNEQGKLHEFEAQEKKEENVENKEVSNSDGSMNWRKKASNDDDRQKALRPVRRYDRYDRSTSRVSFQGSRRY